MAVKTAKTKTARTPADGGIKTSVRKPSVPVAKKVATPDKVADKSAQARTAPAKIAPAKVASTAPTKAAPARAGATKAASAKAAPAKVAPASPPKPAAKCTLDHKTFLQVRETLIKTRERLTGQMLALADDSLKYIDDTSSEDRTDDFDREFALNLVSSEHDAVFEIDNALRRMAEGTYGVCDMCGCALEKARLMALPFARMCVKCQSESERGRSRFRPFGDSLAQGVEPTPEPSEAEETE